MAAEGTVIKGGFLTKQPPCSSSHVSGTHSFDTHWVTDADETREPKRNMMWSLSPKGSQSNGRNNTLSHVKVSYLNKRIPSHSKWPGRRGLRGNCSFPLRTRGERRQMQGDASDSAGASGVRPRSGVRGAAGSGGSGRGPAPGRPRSPPRLCVFQFPDPVTPRT